MTWMAGFLVLLITVGYTAITWAGPPQGVTATLIGRATYGKFKVKTQPPESEEINPAALLSPPNSSQKVSSSFRIRIKPP